MNLLIGCLYLFFAFLFLVFINFYDQKYSFTKSQIIVFRIIYLLLLSGIFSYFGFNQFNQSIFMIVIFEFVLEMIYISYFLEKDFFCKEDSRLKDFVVGFIFSFLINEFFINKVDSVFLSPLEFRVIVWVFVIIYLYKFINSKDGSTLTLKKDNNYISRENIVVNYAKLKLEYGKLINVDDKNLLMVLYSIMIFQNYKRPKFFRRVDNLLYKINGDSRKLGIMQVMSKKYIDDVESINIVSKKLLRLIEKYKGNKKDIYNKIIEGYDKDNSLEINYIYSELKKFSDL